MHYVKCCGIALLAISSVAPAAEPDPAGYLLAPRAFRAAAARVLPSMVTIETYGGVSGGGKKGKISGISGPGDGPTTGVIVSSDGLIVTSTFNFIRKPPIITVTLRDGSQHVAELLGRDETRKICLLKIAGVKNLPVPTFVPRSDVKVGQWAISLGVGYGDDDPALSAGIVSATNRISGKAVQTDANTSPANYGGPLLDIEGRVIGICVPLTPSSQAEGAGVDWYDSGIGFAVPLHGADDLIAAMKAGKTIQTGKLGIQTKAATEQGGVVVAGIMENSPAGKAGIKPGDEIVAIAGEKVQDLTQLRAVMGRFIVGDEVTLSVKRKDGESDIKVILAALPDSPAGAPQVEGGKPGPRPKGPGK